MKPARGMWAFIGVWIFGIFGSLWTASAEGMIPAAPSQFAPHAVIFSTPVPFPTLTSTPLLGQTAVALPPSPTPRCHPPANWQAITIAPNDTLQALAARYHTTPERLQRANCLTVTTLLPGTRFYVPPLPTPSASATPPPSPTLRQCRPPSGWIVHIVQPGENLYRLSLAYRVSVTMLQRANCLPGTLIYTGQRLWVPNVPTITPTWTVTASPTATFTSTPTFTPTPTVTPTPLPTPTPPPTPTPTFTNTPIPPTTPPPPPSPTSTLPPPTDTPTPTPTPTPTNTPTDTPTPLPPPTPTPTSTS